MFIIPTYEGATRTVRVATEPPSVAVFTVGSSQRATVCFVVGPDLRTSCVVRTCRRDGSWSDAPATNLFAMSVTKSYIFMFQGGATLRFQPTNDGSLAVDGEGASVDAIPQFSS